MTPLRVLDLFSGIGGFSLGLERTGGFKTVAFCEIEPFPRRVLAKHWPEVPCYDDVRTLTADRLRSDGIAVDVICGGFPCQDISFAGKGAGLAGERSGLWSEIARLAGELRPSFIIVESVSALLSRGLDAVLGDLAALGYDAEWHCISAAAVGAPHIRDRVWLVCWPSEAMAGTGCQWGLLADTALRRQRSDKDDANRPAQCESVAITERSGPALADSDREGFQVAWPITAGANREQIGRVPSSSGWWAVEPAMGRVAHGVPGRVDRLRALGNAVVPQIPELIGNAILASLAEQEAA